MIEEPSPSSSPTMISAPPVTPPDADWRAHRRRHGADGRLKVAAPGSGHAPRRPAWRWRWLQGAGFEMTQLAQNILRVGQDVHQMADRRALVAADIADAALQQGLGDGEDAFAGNSSPAPSRSFSTSLAKDRSAMLASFRYRRRAACVHVDVVLANVLQHLLQRRDQRRVFGIVDIVEIASKASCMAGQARDSARPSSVRNTWRMRLSVNTHRAARTLVPPACRACGSRSTAR